MVSIVITAYNVADTICRAVDSALSQTYSDIEVVVVEDCSTDNTLELLEQYGSTIRLITQPYNQGAGVARRDGIKASLGDFVITLDADDWMDEDLVERLVARQQETGAEIVSGGVTIERAEGAWEAHCYAPTIIENPKERIMSFLQEKVQFMNNKLIARRLLNEVEYCSRRFIEDTPTIIPMLYLAEKFAYCSSVGYHYLDNPKSLTHKADAFKWQLFSACATLDIMSFFEKHEYKDMNELLAQSFLSCTKNLSQVKPTLEQVKLYQEEWNYYTTELIRRNNG
jgi:glycosyltransferase involved in cell wall biosynthesis